jgi:NAD(P)H dehydrogenase (quinone)
MHWINLGVMPGWHTSDGSPEELNRLGSALGAMAQSFVDQPPDVVPQTSDLRTAYELDVRVATVTHQWLRGRASVGELV